MTKAPSPGAISTTDAVAARYAGLFDARPADGAATGWLSARRREALDRFLKNGFPTRATEAFRKLDARAHFAQELPLDAEPADAARALDAHTWLADGALAASTLDVRGPLDLLNLALHRGEGVVEIAADRNETAPIVVVHAPVGPDSEHFPRTVVVARAGSSAVIVERFDVSGAHRVTSAVDVVVERGATLTHVIVHASARATRVFASVRATVHDGGTLSLHTFALADGLVRQDVDVELAGKDARATLQSLTLGRGASVCDQRTRVVHAHGHATSRQLVKSVLADESKGVFSGAVVFARGAEKSDTAQHSKALLLSPRAEVDHKPELQIFADDVAASHGSTVGQLDDDALFYLRARGVPHDEARAMLVRAFLDDTIAALPESVREDARARVEARVASVLGEQTSSEGSAR